VPQTIGCQNHTSGRRPRAAQNPKKRARRWVSLPTLKHCKHTKGRPEGPHNLDSIPHSMTMSNRPTRFIDMNFKDNASMHFAVYNGHGLNLLLGNSRGEGFVKRVFHHVLAGCKADDKALDIGANAGFYSMMAAAHGCHVTAFEPQPECQARIRAAIRMNGFEQRVSLVPRPVSAKAFTLNVNQGSCALMFSPFITTRQPATIAISSTCVQDELPPRQLVRLCKVDVEGAELDVLSSLDASLIQNLVVELSPGWWTRALNHTRQSGARLLAQFWTQGGFRRAQTAKGKVFSSAEEFAHFILTMRWRSYEDQQDVWMTKEPKLMEALDEWT